MAFWKGALITLVGASLWGVSGACSQSLFTDYGISPAFVTAARMMSGAVVFLAVLLVRHRSAVRFMLTDGKTFRSLLLFALGLFGSQFTFLFSVECTNAGTATVLQMISTIFIMVYACGTSRKLPRFGEVLGTIVAIFGTFLIATQGKWDTLVLPLDGLIWALINCIAIAVYIICPKDSGLFDACGSFGCTGMAMLLGGLMALTTCIGMQMSGADVLVGVGEMDLRAWVLLLGGVGFVGTFAAFALYLDGCMRVGSIAGGLLGAAEPVSAQVCAAVFLGTAFSGYDWAGLALMIVMVILLTVEPKPKNEAKAKRFEQLAS